MAKRSWRIWIGGLLALLSLVVLTASFKPLGRVERSFAWHGALEGRELAVDLPRAIWSGDGGRATLVLAPGVQVEPVQGNLVLEARLELAGIAVQPQDSISEAVQPGQGVHFTWSLGPAPAGVYQGTLWVYLNTVPKSGGDADRQALLARPVKIEARDAYFGLPVRIVRWAGLLGLLLGLVLVHPLLKKIK